MRSVLIAAGGLVVGTILAVLAVVGIWVISLCIRPDQKSAQAAVPGTASPAGIAHQNEIEQTSKEIIDLNKERVRLESESEELKQKRDALQREIENLTTRLDALGKWKRSDFMMVNANSFAVGIKVDPEGQLQIVQKAEGQFQQDAIRWARKAGQHPIDQDHALTRRIFATIPLGSTVPDSLADEIRQYWRPQRFVPIPPDKLDPSFVVFQDAGSGKRHIGYYLGNDAEQLRFREVAATDDSIHRSQVQVGCIRVAAGNKILTSLSDGDFLDYSVLSAAQKLGSPDGKPSTIRVAVHMEVDALKEEKSLSELQDTRWEDQVFEFYARMHEKPYPRDSRKEPVRVLRETAMYVEDELYQKLTKLGIPVVERQQTQSVVEESNFGKPLSHGTGDYLSQLGATHMLCADLKKSQDGGRYHLAFRLTDVRRGEVLWAESGERLVPLPNIQQRFLLQSGSLAVIKLKPGTTTPFHGCENPPIVMPATVVNNSQREHLVVVDDPFKADVISYRSLFETVRREIPRKEVESVVLVKKDQDVPTTFQLRYIVWKLASKTLPVAGRAVRIDGNQATISLGSRDGVKQQDTLYVIRQRAAGAGVPNQHLQDSQILLATSLSVSEVYEDFSRVLIRDSGLVGWDLEKSLMPDDLVITNSGKILSIAMLAPGWKQPDKKVFEQLHLNFPKPLMKVMSETEHTSLKVKGAIGSGLRALGIPIFTEVEKNAVLVTGASHIFGGYIEPLDRNRYHVETMVFPLNARNIGLIRDPKMSIAQLGQEIVRVEADINLSSFK